MAVRGCHARNIPPTRRASDSDGTVPKRMPSQPETPTRGRDRTSPAEMDDWRRKAELKEWLLFLPCTMCSMLPPHRDAASAQADEKSPTTRNDTFLRPFLPTRSLLALTIFSPVRKRARSVSPGAPPTKGGPVPSSKPPRRKGGSSLPLPAGQKLMLLLFAFSLLQSPCILSMEDLLAFTTFNPSFNSLVSRDA